MATIKNLQIDGDFHCFQDSYLCDENIQHLRGDTYYYSDWNQISIESLEDLFEIPETIRKGKLLQFLVEYHNYNDFSWAKFKEDIIAEIFANYSIKTIKDFIYDLENFGIELERKFYRHVSRGYSQGDYAEIFIPEKLKEIWGCDDETFEKGLPNLEEELDHYCWDSKVSGTFNISFEYEIVRETMGDSLTLKFDEEFEYPEWSNSCWELAIDIERVIDYINKKTYNNLDAESLEKIREQLGYFDYNDIKY